MNAPFDDRMDADLGAHAQGGLPSSPAEFLDALRPGGPWMVLAIDPDRGRNNIDALTVATVESARRFVAKYDGKRNLYYSLNPLRRAMNKKAKKEDVAAVEFIGADLDPDEVESSEVAKKRYLALLAGLKCPPTFVLDSGNGLNVAWRLAVPLGPEEFEKAEAVSKSIMQKLGSVAGTQNTDRILRLPSTTNLPTAAKIKKGRVKCQSALLSFDGASYLFSELEDFEKSLPEPKVRPGHKGRAKSGSPNDAGTREVKRRPDIDRLPIPARIKNLIRGIDDPDHTYPSRSEKVFAVLVAMASGGCTDEQMASVLLDPELPISAHVLEQRNPNPEEYLKRQIAKGREAAMDPDVTELNETYAAVRVGGNVLVMQLEGDDVMLMKYEAFKHWLANRFVQIGKKRVPLAKYWFEHPQRRQYNGIVFAPGREMPGYFNFWRGFAVDPRPGDCSKFLAHLKDNVCRGDDALFKWVVGWFAEIVQRPDLKGGMSLVIRGKEGTGKTKVGEVIGSLLGKHYIAVSDQQRITGRFNSHMLRLLLLHAEEAFWAGSKEAEGKLKDLVTGKRHLVEFKGKDAIEVDNFIRLLVTGNPDWVVPVGLQGRRFAVLEIGEARMKDHAYFAAIDEEMANGGRAALLDYLLKFDLSKVDMRSIPRTSALLAQKLYSLTPEQGWWLDVLSRGQLPGTGRVGCECPTSALFDAYVEHGKKMGVNRRSLETVIGIFLRTMAPGLRKKEAAYAGGFVYEFPPLGECRAAFAKLLQQEVPWAEPSEWRASERLL